jgi:hypothetical protein
MLHISAVSVAATLSLPQVAEAHSVHPMYVGLGLFSLYLIWATMGLALASLLLMYLIVLRLLVSPDRTIISIAWRAALIFVVAKTAECGLSVPWFMHGCGMAGEPIAQTTFAISSLLGVNFAVTLLLIGLLFQSDAPRSWRVLLASLILSVGTYALSMLWVLLGFQFGWIR